jgi:hypothetical protein
VLLFPLQGIISGLNTFLTVDKDVCGSWAGRSAVWCQLRMGELSSFCPRLFPGGYILAQGLVILAAVTATVANKSADILIKLLVKFERHRSVSKVRLCPVVVLSPSLAELRVGFFPLQQSWAYASKSLVAKFINTGWVVLVVYGSLPNGGKSVVQTVGILNGKNDDLNTDWYTSAGVYVSTVMLLNSAVPLAAPALEFLIRRIKQFVARKPKVSVSCVGLSDLRDS